MRMWSPTRSALPTPNSSSMADSNSNSMADSNSNSTANSNGLTDSKANRADLTCHGHHRTNFHGQSACRASKTPPTGLIFLSPTEPNNTLPALPRYQIQPSLLLRQHNQKLPRHQNQRNHWHQQPMLDTFSIIPNVMPTARGPSTSTTLHHHGQSFHQQWQQG